MIALRRVLAPFTAMWLFCHAGSVVLFPVVLWVTAADSDVADCTCVHGPDMVCPMHQKPAKSSGPCGMQAANTHDAVLTTLAGAAGLIPDPALLSKPAELETYVGRAAARSIGLRPVPPDPPPPRA